MPYNQESRNRIILDKPEDWEGWISHIKGVINDPTIWDLVNPDIPVKPTLCVYPEERARPQPNATGQFDLAQIEQYKALKLFREEDLAVFNYEDKGLREVNKLIYETTCARMIHQVAYSQSDPWSKLVALKQRLKPSSQSKALLVEKRYHQLAKGPGNQDIESWLNEWMDMYQESVRVDLPEALGNRAIRDFFLAINTVDPIYSNTRQEARNNIEEQNVDLLRKVCQRTMEEEIEKYRNRLKLQTTSSAVTDTRTTLALHIPATPNTPTLKGKDQKEKEKA
ncbi:hypothetical protein MMC29_008098 [Sticta canariensis]|nr:hypothetical protein [Sticta canariensis]